MWARDAYGFDGANWMELNGASEGNSNFDSIPLVMDAGETLGEASLTSI